MVCILEISAQKGQRHLNPIYEWVGWEISNMTRSRFQAFVLVGRMGQSRRKFNRIKHKVLLLLTCLRQLIRLQETWVNSSSSAKRGRVLLPTSSVWVRGVMWSLESEKQSYGNECAVLNLIDWRPPSAPNTQDPTSLGLSKCHWLDCSWWIWMESLFSLKKSLNLVESFRFYKICKRNAVKSYNVAKGWLTSFPFSLPKHSVRLVVFIRWLTVTSN